jgi:hypothetical protein
MTQDELDARVGALQEQVHAHVETIHAQMDRVFELYCIEHNLEKSKVMRAYSIRVIGWDPETKTAVVPPECPLGQEN